jgi:hypothetical protein
MAARTRASRCHQPVATYSTEIQQRPHTAASSGNRQHTQQTGTTAKSPAAPLVRDEEAAGSNPATPTMKPQVTQHSLTCGSRFAALDARFWEPSGSGAGFLTRCALREHHVVVMQEEFVAAIRRGQETTRDVGPDVGTGAPLCRVTTRHLYGAQWISAYSALTLLRRARRCESHRPGLHERCG